MRIEKDRNDNKDYFTLGIVKPDAMDHIEEIIDKINDYGLKIFHFKYLIFTEELIDEHYAHVKKFNEEIFNNLKSELEREYGCVNNLILFTNIYIFLIY